jgi:flagellar motor switch/type III secretory pathway protein FliN
MDGLASLARGHPYFRFLRAFSSSLSYFGQPIAPTSCVGFAFISVHWYLMTETTESSTALTIGSKSPAHPKPKNWSAFQLLPCRLSLEIPIPGFTVSAMLRLSPNVIIDTHWLQGSDVPLRVNGKLIGWTEFEVIDDHLAARLTQNA